MPRFFVSSADLEEENGTTRIVLGGSDVAHISRALRMRPGETLVLCDENGTEYRAVIESAGETVRTRVLSRAPSESEPPYEAVVYQALCRGERFDTVVMKATELGASRIVPVVTSRCTVKLDGADRIKKRDRWQKIAAEAAGQSGRGRIPEVAEPMKFSDAVKEAAKADLPLFCYEGGEGAETFPLPALFPMDPPRTAAVFVGPEGGFEPAEAGEAVREGMRPACLGRRILRTETAAPFVLACLSFRYELNGGSAGTSNE